MAIALAAPLVVQADFTDDANWPELVDRIGLENVPDGTNIMVCQVEALSGSSYGPNQSDDEFASHTFIDRGPGSSGTSSHANNVAKHYYGVLTSMTPAADPVNLYEANGWCTNDFLRANFSSSTPPLALPAGIKIINQSWIGSFGNVTNDQNALRRMDYAITRDDTLIAVGVNNGSSSSHLPLLCYAYNNISVGIKSGNHANADTASNYEGGGRMKPEICARSSATSFSTPIVASAAAMLVQQVREDSNLHSDGERPEVLKALLMSAANHQDESADDGSWSNEASESGSDRGMTSRPLDMVQGAGQVDVNRGHLIMSGGRITGGVSPGTTPDAPLYGWDWAFCLPGNSRTWDFSLGGAVDEVSIVAAWSRQVPLGFGTNWTLGDFDLELVELDADGNPISLVGSGPEVFESGNVYSASAVDNVEHLYIRGLAAGQYQLRLSLVDGGGASNARAGIAWYFSEPDIVDVPGDINGDGQVNVDDLLQLLSEYGNCNGNCASDLDGDGDSDVNDLLLLLSYL